MGFIRFKGKQLTIFFAHIFLPFCNCSTQWR